MTGINANLQYGGITYHIQTEDGGTGNPIITTLLFKEGAIFSSKKTNYKELLQTDSFEETVKRLMEAQHMEMIQELTAGKFKQDDDAEQPTPSSTAAPSSVRMAAQTQAKSSPPMEEIPLKTKNSVGRKRKGLDALIHDYLANKKTSQD